MPATVSISADDLKTLSQQRILFGHQSVGMNIISGITSQANPDGMALKVFNSRTVTVEPGIYHFNVGKNEDPLSKIKDFATTLSRNVSQQPDIALMKLCYIDINSESDVRNYAAEYISSFERLSKQFPKTRFVAVTVPLRTVQTGPKAWLKQVMGRPVGGYADNFKRQEFNDILRNRFGQQGELFDLARVESKAAGTHFYRGKPLEVLNPVFTDDGGHLNSAGAQFVAVKLLTFLAGASKHP